DAPFVSVEAGLSTGSALSPVQSLAIPQPQAFSCALAQTTTYLGSRSSVTYVLSCGAQLGACPRLGGTANQNRPSRDCSTERQAVLDAKVNLDNAKIELN